MLISGFLLRRRVCQLAVLLLASGLGLAVQAAAQATSGTITGTITDAQGGALPGVTLAVRNAETGLSRTTISEGDGSYRFAGLPPGRYDLKVELAGFATAEVKDLTLTIGLELRRDVKMTIQTLQETVTVTGQAPVVETTKSEVAGVVTQQQIESLPIESRQPTNLALLLPGTAADAVRPRRTNANIGPGGVSHFSSTYLVDGTLNLSTNAGEPRLDYPQGAVREFKVHLTQAPAEFGGTTGGVVSVVTKGGTNLWSGEAFEFFRDKSLNALNKFEQQLHDEKGEPKPEFRRHQYGASFGGPIVKDRLHFFASVQRTEQRTFFNVSTGKPEFYSALEGVFPNDYEGNLLFGRGDLQITPQQTLFVRYGYMGETSGCENCGGTAAAFTSNAIYSPRDSLVTGHTWVLGSRVLNEVRFQGPSRLRQDTVAPGTPFWSEVGEFPPERYRYVTQVYTFPSLTWGSGTTRTVRHDLWPEIRNDLTINADWKGSHTVKVGGSFYHSKQLEEVSSSLGTWTFSTDQPFNPNDPASFARLRTPIQFIASFPPLVRPIRNQYVQAYVQDEWRPRSNLTLNLGLRYDLQLGMAFNKGLDLSLYPRPLPFVDPSVRGDKDNVAPRLGFAWDVRNDGKSVVRGGYGIYYQYMMMASVSGEITTLRQANIRITNPSYPDPYQGQDPLRFASTAPPNITINANDMRNPSAETASLGLSQELRSNLAIHVDGVYTKTTGFPVTLNINTVDAVTRRRPLPEWGQINQNQSVGDYKYRALMVRLDKRFANRHQYLVSYTLAKQDNDFTGTGTFTGSITDFYNPGLDWGPSNADRRHSLAASGSVLLPYDVSLGAVWTLRSTMPFDARAGRDLNGDGVVNDYVPGTTRNIGNRDNARMLELVNAWRAANGRTPISEGQIDSNRYQSLNVRVSKAIPLGGSRRLELIGQVFNMLGTDNLFTPGSGTWVTNALSDSFGRVLTAQPRQQAELAVQVVW